MLFNKICHVCLLEGRFYIFFITFLAENIALGRAVYQSSVWRNKEFAYNAVDGKGAHDNNSDVDDSDDNGEDNNDNDDDNKLMNHKLIMCVSYFKYSKICIHLSPMICNKIT